MGNHIFFLACDLHELKTMVKKIRQNTQMHFMAPHLAMKWFFLSTVFFVFTLSPISSPAADSCKKIFLSNTKEQQIIAEFKKGSQSFQLSQELVYNIKEKSPTQQDQWLQAIANVYRIVPKKDPSLFAAWHIGGRRLLDRSLTLLERYDQKFAEDVKNGKTARQAYANFLNHQQKLFKTDYSEAEIIKILRFLKEDLTQLQKGRSGPEIRLLLAGSFINGKAHLKDSDIDISMNDPKLVSEVPRWQEKINDIFAKTNNPSSLTIEAHSEPEFFYGKINPVVISVSASKTEIIVFPPALSSQMAGELIAAKPTTYAFDL